VCTVTYTTSAWAYTYMHPHACMYQTTAHARQLHHCVCCVTCRIRTCMHMDTHLRINVVYRTKLCINMSRTRMSCTRILCMNVLCMDMLCMTLLWIHVLYMDKWCLDRLRTDMLCISSFCMVVLRTYVSLITMLCTDALCLGVLCVYMSFTTELCVDMSRYTVGDTDTVVPSAMPTCAYHRQWGYGCTVSNAGTGMLSAMPIRLYLRGCRYM
jgi:hypothetical protein